MRLLRSFALRFVFGWVLLEQGPYGTIWTDNHKIVRCAGSGSPDTSVCEVVRTLP